MKPPMNAGKLMAIGTAIAVVLAVTISIWLDPPWEVRARTMDRQRLQRLSRIEASINTYFTAHKALPTDLNVLDAEKNQLLYEAWHDPDSGEPFEYEVTGEKSYRLCAHFARDADDSTIYYYRKHTVGRDCFEYSIKQQTNG